MKTLLPIATICTVLGANLACAESTNAPPMGSTAYMDYCYGFAGAKFGQPLSDFKDLEFEEKFRDNETYCRVGKSQIVGGLEVKDVLFTFYKGRLMKIGFVVDEGGEFDKAKDAWLTAYGKGKQDDTPLRIVHWYGSKVTAQVGGLGPRGKAVFLFVMWDNQLHSLSMADSR